VTDLSANEQQFVEGVRQHLEILHAPLLVELRQMIALPLPDDLAVLSFEIFSDGFTTRFPVMAYPMDLEATQLDWPELGANDELLKGAVTYPESFEEPFKVNGRFSFDAWSLATHEALIPWFAQVWIEAGGEAFSVPATIGHQDGSEEFNLQTGEWQDANSLFEAA
jgi:hypothetical protein